MALSDNLVSYWKLDESSGNATDSVGSNTGTNVNTVTYTTGKINNGADFNGTTQRFTCGTSLASAYSGLTLNAWVKTDALGNYRRILSKTDNTTFNQMIRMTNGNVFAGHVSTTTESTITGSTSISTGTWYMVTLTYDGSNVRLYVNASEDATAIAKTGSLKTSSETFGIGAEVKSGAEFWDGLIDEPGVWSRALTGAEITSLYNSGNGNQYPFSTDYPLTADVGAFTLTGIATVFNLGRNMVASAGSFVLTGITTILSFGRIMATTVGVFTLTGFDILIYYGKQLIAEVGTFTLTGIDAIITSTRTMIADTTSFALTGISALFSIGKTLVADVTTFTLTGIDAILSYGRGIVADVANFTLTGIDVTFSRTMIMVAEVGSFVLSFKDFIIRVTGWRNPFSKNNISATNTTKNSENWINQSKS